MTTNRKGASESESDQSQAKVYSIVRESKMEVSRQQKIREAAGNFEPASGCIALFSTLTRLRKSGVTRTVDSAKGEILKCQMPQPAVYAAWI
jgi:hypothetical protein